MSGAAESSADAGMKLITCPHRQAGRDLDFSFVTRRSEPAAHADFVEVCEQVAGVLVDPEGARVEELLAAITARQQADPERASAPGGEQIPHAVADHDAVFDVDADARGG